jgi:hypothetical protein
MSDKQAELKHLRGVYIIASMRAAEIMTTRGTDDREALAEILKQDRKAGEAIRQIEAIYGGGGKSTTFPGATEPPNTLK